VSCCRELNILNWVTWAVRCPGPRTSASVLEILQQCSDLGFRIGMVNDPTRRPCDHVDRRRREAYENTFSVICRRFPVFVRSPAYAGSQDCPSSAVVCYGGWIKPWRNAAGCPPKPLRRRTCFGGFRRRYQRDHGCKAVGLHHGGGQ
jgi:hypothetical protein